MANPRDVQKEIDTLQKGIKLAMDEFNEVREEFEQVLASGDRNAKEKIDAELNKHYRHIVTLRSEVIRVGRYKTIKDSSDLDKMRTDSEACMLFFKKNHKELKVKSFSAKGLAKTAAEESKNPKTRAENWLTEAIEEMGYSIDQLDFDLEEKKLEVGPHPSS